MPGLRALFVPLALLALLVGLSPHLLAWASSGEVPDALVWNMTHYHVNYFEHGFLRRGLVGTLVHPVFSALPDGGAAEYAVMLGIGLTACLGLILTARTLLVRATPHGAGGWLGLLALALILSPAGFMQMGYDMARLDQLNFVLVALALLCVSRGRVLAAGALMGAATLVHEAVLFYGVPVVAGLAWSLAGPDRLRALLIAALPASAVAVLLVLFGDTPVDLASALSPEINLAAPVWTRDMLHPAWGWPPLHYLIAAYFALVPLFLLHRYYVLNRAAPDLLFLAPFAGLALFALGVDYGRWSHCIFFATLCVIFAAPALNRRPGVELSSRPIRWLITPWLLPLGPIGIAVLYPFIPFIV